MSRVIGREASAVSGILGTLAWVSSSNSLLSLELLQLPSAQLVVFSCMGPALRMHVMCVRACGRTGGRASGLCAMTAAQLQKQGF